MKKKTKLFALAMVVALAFSGVATALASNATDSVPACCAVMECEIASVVDASFESMAYYVPVMPVMGLCIRTFYTTACLCFILL